MIELKVNVPEVRSYINEILRATGRIFDVVRYNVRESAGNYFSYLMESELTFYLGRERYERPCRGKINYRNGGYSRRFTLKGIGEVRVNVPRDRAGKFKASIIPGSKQYEDRIREDLSLMFFSGSNYSDFELDNHPSYRKKAFPFRGK